MVYQESKIFKNNVITFIQRIWETLLQKVSFFFISGLNKSATADLLKENIYHSEYYYQLVHAQQFLQHLNGIYANNKKDYLLIVNDLSYQDQLFKKLQNLSRCTNSNRELTFGSFSITKLVFVLTVLCLIFFLFYPSSLFFYHIVGVWR